MTTQLEESKKREVILTSHLKQRSEDLSKLEATIGQHEEKVNFVSVHLEEEKRADQVMKIH